MISPILIMLLILLFLLMWTWIITIFIANMIIKKKINVLISQPLSVEQKEELDNLQLELDINAYRAKMSKRIVLTFSFLYIALAVVLVWLNSKFLLFTYDGLVDNLKLTMFIVILMFVPAYVGLEIISNTEGASSDIASKLKFTEELKPGEEVEV